MGCQTSKDVLSTSPSEQRPSLGEIYLHAALKQHARDEMGVGARRPPTADSHRDVFSIFGERGMSVEKNLVLVSNCIGSDYLSHLTEDSKMLGVHLRNTRFHSVSQCYRKIDSFDKTRNYFLKKFRRSMWL
ncbi:hypothetical protein PsorP6_008054 [Peronosclerospora sorghi]|uniref:Uncharacterized protein n=1 Tax=Peronosclerospora sorghi TaxID=230839 RepID=A0ACC0WAM7_9STRA|nr:hypothetical protein PsorP6_008054 [Peronosclerospora sorghi]